MWRHFTELRERCIGCGARVDAGFGEASPDDESNSVALGCIIDESEPYPRCGTELTYPCEQDWADCCALCERELTTVHPFDRYWDTELAQYRWWCSQCSWNKAAIMLANWSPWLARVLWWPLLFCSLVGLFLFLVLLLLVDLTRSSFGWPTPVGIKRLTDFWQ